ncbi:MAG: hypothetical protein ACI4VL_02330 [Bacilli bacterium]
MRTVINEYNIYKYNELSDEAKENVKKWYLDNQKSDIYTDMCMEDLSNLFGYNNDLQVQYSLSCSQGDGFNIYGTIGIKDIYNCLKNRNGGKQLEKYEDIISDNEWKILFEYAEFCNDIKLPYNRRYSYCMVDYIDITGNWYNVLNDEMDYIDNEYIGENKPIPDCLKSIDINLLKKFEKLVKGIFKTLCDDYEENGYKFFYEIEDNELNEICEINDYEFLENGNIYNELMLYMQ